jgi:hypothetical protein
MNKTKPILFSGNFITKDDKVLDISEFKSVLVGNEESEIIGNVVHSYSIEFMDNYLRINFSDSSSFPRNPNVINIDTNEIEPNPRQSNQIEPKEHFAIIDFETCILWISSSKKRKMIIDYLSRKFKKSSFVVKDVYDQNEFIKTIKRLDDLRISATPNLFSQTSTLSKAFSDEINQFEAVEAVLHLKYQDKWIGNSLSDRIKSLFSHKENYRGIMISGRDEKNNGLLFNSNVFSKRIEFKAHVDDNEMFDSVEVFEILISKVEDEKN